MNPRNCKCEWLLFWILSLRGTKRERRLVLFFITLLIHLLSFTSSFLSLTSPWIWHLKQISLSQDKTWDVMGVVILLDWRGWNWLDYPFFLPSSSSLSTCPSATTTWKTRALNEYGAPPSSHIINIIIVQFKSLSFLSPNDLESWWWQWSIFNESIASWGVFFSLEPSLSIPFFLYHRHHEILNCQSTLNFEHWIILGNSSRGFHGHFWIELIFGGSRGEGGEGPPPWRSTC